MTLCGTNTIRTLSYSLYDFNLDIFLCWCVVLYRYGCATVGLDTFSKRAVRSRCSRYAQRTFSLWRCMAVCSCSRSGEASCTAKVEHPVSVHSTGSLPVSVDVGLLWASFSFLTGSTEVSRFLLQELATWLFFLQFFAIVSQWANTFYEEKTKKGHSHRCGVRVAGIGTSIAAFCAPDFVYSLPTTWRCGSDPRVNTSSCLQKIPHCSATISTNRVSVCQWKS